MTGSIPPPIDRLVAAINRGDIEAFLAFSSAARGAMARARA